MSQNIRALWQNVKLLAIGVVFSVLLGTSPVQAQDGWGYSARSAQADINAAFNSLGRLPTLRSSELDDALSRLGFAHHMPAHAWQALSDKEQLSAAYRWASAAGGPENGNRLLTAVAHDYAKRYESVQFDPVFQQMFTAGTTPLDRIEFRRPTLSQLADPLPREVSRLIRQLSIYVDGPGPLGRANIARKIFGLEGDSLEDSLSERKPREFLHAGARRAAVPPPVYQRLNELVRDVIIASEAAGADPELARLAAEFRKKFGDLPTHLAGTPRSSVVNGRDHVVPDPLGHGPDISNPRPLGGPDASGMPGVPGASGGSPERTARAAEMHRSFDAKHYPERAQARYSSVRVRGGGRGGVIAGADVTSELGDAHLVAFKSRVSGNCAMRGKDIAKGELVVVSGKGTFTMMDVNCDTFFAARRLVYEDLGVTPWQSGDAIGLASIDTDGDLTKTFPYFLSAELDLARAGRRRGMLLHPALTDLDIGRAIALLDLWPSAGLLIRTSTSNDPAVIAWLKQLDDASTWKWSDSPATITANKSTLVVRAKSRRWLTSQRTFTSTDLIAEQAADPQWRASMLVRFKEKCQSNGQPSIECGASAKNLENALLKASSASAFGTEVNALDAAVPALARNINDFARAEELFRVLSLMRWAKTSGAPLPTSDITLAASRVTTPDSIVIGILGDYIAGASRAGDWSQECRVFADRLKKSLLQLSKERDSPGRDRRETAWTLLASEMRATGELHGTKNAPEVFCAK